ncbi:MAG TPA: hypothetical protein VD965_08670 [Burkholderiales bacterium]|nr:hypothetical protein [Burkholderiales bacterium]
MKRFLLVLLFPLTAAAEPATVIRPTELKKEPASDAQTIAHLAESAAVDALERKGGWTRVKAGAAEGWVRMLALRYGGDAAAKPGDSGVSQLFNAARTGSSGTQVTTGVRGLDAEQISTAQPNAAEMKKLAGFAASKDAAAGFAQKGRLEAKALEYPK